MDTTKHTGAGRSGRAVLGKYVRRCSLLTALSAGIALVAACASTECRPTMKILVGTYTDGTGSRGIYLYELDAESLEYHLLDTAAAGNPSFVIPSADRKYAYAVSEFSDGRQGVYSLALGDESVDVLGFRSGTGADPCNIVSAGGNIISSDYTGGTVSVFPLPEDGVPDTTVFRITPGQDVASHIHCAVVSPDSLYVFITDLGADNIYRVTLDADGGLPDDFRTAYSFDRREHPGPRHITFSDDGHYAYVISELGDCISSFVYENGMLRHLSTIKAYDGGGCGSADIHVSPDGRFIYTSHRLKEDGIGIFRRNPETGIAERAGYCPTGRHPRNFAISPDGRLLLCACRDDNRIEIYSVDLRTGALTFTGRTIEVPAPVCVQIL